MKLRSKIRKAVRLAGLTLGVVLGSAAVLLLLLQVSWVRGKVLHEVIQRSSNSLPGKLVVQQAAWPGLAHLRLTDVVWTAEGDTLAQIDLIDLRWNSLALLSRQIQVDNVEIVVAQLDLPLLQKVLQDADDAADAEPSAAPQADASGGLPWFRDGSVPNAPSLVIEALHVAVQDMQLSGTSRIDHGSIDMALDLRHGAPPKLAVSQLQLKLSEPDIEIRQAVVQVDLESGNLQVEVESAEGSLWNLAITGSHSAAQGLVLQVQVGESGEAPLDVLALRGTFLKQGTRSVGLKFTSQITTPDVAALRRLDVLQDKLQAIADLPGVVLDVSGIVQWQPGWRSDIDVQLQPNAWLVGGGCRLQYDADSLSISDAELRLADLRLTGRWQRDAVTASGQFQAKIRGTQWWRDVLPEVAAPDSLGLDLQATLRGQGATQEWHADLRAGLRHGGVSIEDLLLTVVSTNKPPQRARFHLQARMQGWDIQTDGEVAPGPEVQAQLSPIVVVVAGKNRLLPWTQPIVEPRADTRFAWSEKSGLQLNNLQVAGDLGELQAQAQWQRQAGGTAELQASWPQPPGYLLHVLSVDSLQSRKLQQRWGEDVTPELHLVAQLPGQRGTRNLNASGHLVLPGPRSFADVLPDSIRVDDLDAIRARLSFHWEGDSLRSAWSAAVDLNQTAWLDSTEIRAHARGDSLFLESLRFLWEGIDVQLAGVSDTANVHLQGGLRLDAAQLLARLPQTWAANSMLLAQAEWEIDGSPEAPEVDVELWSQVHSPWGRVPVLRGSVRWREGVLQFAQLDTPEGLTFGDLQWDHLQLDVQPLRGQARTTSRITLDLAGKQQALRAALRLERAKETIIYGDSLSLRLLDRDLVAQRPFQLRWSPDNGLRIDDFDMAGTLGSMSAHVIARDDTLGLLAEMDLQLPNQPDGLGIPAGMWPQSLKLRAAAADNDSLAVFLQVSGLQVGTRTELALLTSVQATRDSTTFVLRLVDPEGTVVDARGGFPLQWSVRPMEFAMGEGDMRLDTRINDFPLPESFGNPLTAVGYLDRSKSEWGPRLAGELHLGGTPAAPAGYGAIHLQHQEGVLAQYQVNLVLGLSSDSTMAWSADIDQAIRQLSTAEVLQQPGSNIAFWVTRDTTHLMDGAVHLPLTLGFSKGRLHIPADLQVQAAIRSPALQLKELTELLPASTKMDGLLSIDLRAQGALDDPQLAGGLQFTDLALSVPVGSRIRVTGNVEFNGTALDPGVTGRVTVRDGLIRIPELPRELLPLEGEALLLDDVAVADTVATTLALSSAAPRTTHADSSKVFAVPAAPPLLAGGHSEVFLEIPGAFWLRGRGFAVELSGDLQLTLVEGNVRVLGELKAERGDLQLMASKFPIKSGRVSFYGDDETNPSLDLVMGRKYDNVSVEVVVLGTAKDPKFEFRSDPQLSEDEILSYILFGRGSSQLDEAQSSQTLAAASLLSASLGEGIRQKTGVDVISLEQSEETADRASLVVGKYLSPRVLLKYVLDLEEGRGYAINVEYWLRGGLRVLTTTSRFNRSGMELNWSHDY